MLKYSGNTINDWFYNASDIKKVYYNNAVCYQRITNETPIDYSRLYLTFVASESGTFKFSGNSINYSLDSGATWTTLASNTDSPTVQSGSTIMWKGTLTPNSTNGIGTFSSSGKFVAQGNTMSLLYGDNFIGQTSLGNTTYTFNALFAEASGLTRAENMILPATTVTQRCYNMLFYRCYSLTSIPELPATTLATQCYTNMFRECYSLETVPENLFSAATTLAATCFGNTFWDSGIKNVPKLPSTNLATQCYSGMFVGCKNLTSVPSDLLPATTLGINCYYAMFSGCTALATAPELPATTLVTRCYNQMFYGCAQLNSITCLATNISASNCLTDWVNGVASSGTFTKAANMSSWSRGNNGIPNNWTVQNYQT